MHQKDHIPTLIKIGLAHAQFETIHPFLDGNGRVGRLLITLLLCERQVLMQPVLYLSFYFKRHRDLYYEMLQGTRNGDWTIWLKFFLKAIAEVSNEATETARRIVSLRERHRAAIVQNFGRSAANGLTILQSLYSQPYVSVNEIAEQAKVSFTAASSLMNRFVENGILFEITGQARNRRFCYSDYVVLFADN
ncbi:MAG: Fic family protein [Phycisphaerae bacterium]